VLTTLTKQAMPLLRYRTGDMCSIIETPCDCGRTSRRISRIQGRLDDMLIIRGVNVYPSEIESVLYSLPELSAQYQIIVDRVQTLDQLKVRAELSRQCHAQWCADESNELKRRELQTRIASALQERLGLTALVEILDANTLPRSEGKAHHVLDMRTV
jgi:phenylacetate-CoA ligase